MQIICAQTGVIPIDVPWDGIGIKDVINAKFESISLDIFQLYPQSEFENIRKTGTIGNEKNKQIWRNPKLMSGFLQRILEKCNESRLNIGIVRAPFFPSGLKWHQMLLQDKEKREKLLNLLTKINQECIALCGRLGCRYIVIPPVCCRTGNEKARKINEEYYFAMIKAAKENRVNILLENRYMVLNGNLIRGSYSDTLQVSECIDRLNANAGEEIFGFCMDTGVCSLNGQDMQEFVLALGDKIKAVVVRDCNGYHDNALLPFTCVNAGMPQTDWVGLIRGLRKLLYDGILLFDIRDTATAFRPLLVSSLLILTKTIADYFAWQIRIERRLKKYQSIVLFGAGNMCLDYMRCYGETYPPLFTCDNNANRWGTTFCGLEVKCPEELRNIPEECGVFICNIYYKDIEQQLKNLGVSNIEFFNNEYMPSINFDRLEMWKG